MIRYFFRLSIDKCLSLNQPDSELFKLYVRNPIELKKGTPCSLEGVDGLVSVFRVNEINDSTPYKVVLELSPEDYSNLDYRSLHVYARYLNGQFRDDELIPYLNEDKSTVEFEIGEVDEDFIFTLDLSYGGNKGIDSATIELVESEKGRVYGAVKANEENRFFAYDDSLVQTIAFKNEDEWSISIKWSDGINQVYSFHTGKNGYGTGSGVVSTGTLDSNANYCYIVYLNSPLDENQELFTIEPRDFFDLKCNVSFNGEYGYVCKGCENCNFAGFELGQGDINENNILQGQYWTENAINEKYGRVALRNGNSILNESSILLGSTSTGNLGITDSKAFGVSAMNRDNPEQDNIDVRVLEIHPKEKEIVARITVDGKDAFDDVVMKYEDKDHFWTINDDETVKCQDCGELRSSASMNVKSGAIYWMDSNDDFSIWIVSQPKNEFLFKSGIGMKAPQPPMDMDVRFIAPSNGDDISYTVNGNRVKIEIKPKS